MKCSFTDFAFLIPSECTFPFYLEEKGFKYSVIKVQPLSKNTKFLPLDLAGRLYNSV